MKEFLEVSRKIPKGIPEIVLAKISSRIFCETRKIFLQKSQEKIPEIIPQKMQKKILD